MNKVQALVRVWRISAADLAVLLKCSEANARKFLVRGAVVPKKHDARLDAISGALALATAGERDKAVAMVAEIDGASTIVERIADAAAALRN